MSGCSCKKLIRAGFMRLSPKAEIPKYMTAGAAGFDLTVIEEQRLLPGETKVFKTGLAVVVDEGFEMQIRPRSGMSLNSKLRIANSPGTIDCDYRGEVGIIIENTGNVDVTIFAGTRVAQGVIAPVVHAELEEIFDLPETARGSGGFGHTGSN